MNAADIIAGALHAAGCRTAYGIPGGEVLALIEALENAGLSFVLVKHENAGGFMAEGEWHAMSVAGPSAAPGVLVATLGPGMANAVNVIANACQDRVPLIFLTGCVDEAEAASYTHQVFDHQAVLRPIVKASFRVSPGAVGAVMKKAIMLAGEGQPGPVHIDVPISIAEAEAHEQVPVIDPATGLRETAAGGPMLEAARVMLASARRPLMIAGVDAVNEGAGPAIETFCRRFQVPLITSYKAKGLIDEADLLCLGGAGLSPKADGILMPLIARADLVLLAGYDPIEMRIGWRDPWEAARAVEIAAVPRTHGMHQAGATLTGGIAPTLSALGEGVAPQATWTESETLTARGALHEAFAAEPDGWGPATVFHVLRDVMPRETVATADSGAHRILLSQIWRCPSPRTLLQSSGLCTMGCALPLGAGHKRAEPETPVIVFVGDAGLEMGIGELATLRDLQLPAIVVVLVDTSLALIELKQRSGQRANAGVDFGETDFPAVATAFGGAGVWVEDVEDLRREAEAALARKTFTILACRIGRRAYDGKF
ncbi:acetolactate synthase-1/2/3 large subunit [Breoghania corrubedonensis]|uniref:Acetolactate synthase-1/2/3 large subunit n=1 Tax=Breoghania corrubedonensis TaxID=665038 RepID=A0A2T5VFE3_9HYPH|nr:thiamine pyrophosphate-binding protein [Breoghania corrubedonensis]PTW62464.1 acetolactate synthase-1/2/3 large subunit [Breoghania corrubedonensis]